MKREFSAGGIVVNNKGQVLLIQNVSIKDHKINYWGFPKGHIEEGESSKDAAIREVEEEGGVKAVVITKLGDTKYVYVRNGEKIFKKAVDVINGEEPKPSEGCGFCKLNKNNI